MSGTAAPTSRSGRASAGSSAASSRWSTPARPARPTSPAFASSSSSRRAERIFAFLNIGSIGLVACNRVSELIDIRSIDVERTLACVEANRDVIRGIKVRASHVILGSWGITPVKVAKKVARIARLPLMVHVGEPPPTLDEILELLDPGDIVTHCFNGKPGGNILDDEQVCAPGRELRRRRASSSTSATAPPPTRSASPRRRSRAGCCRTPSRPTCTCAASSTRSGTSPRRWPSCWPSGMPFEEVVAAVTVRPMAILGLPTRDLLAPGTPAELTVFDVVEADLDDRRLDGRHGAADAADRAALDGGRRATLVRASRHAAGTTRPRASPADEPD